jgi:hypothetical protein
MGRLKALSIIAGLAVAAALALSACGGSADLLPGKTADQINQNLDQVRARVNEGDCAGAEDAVSEVSEEVDSLGGVDRELKAALREGTTRLGEVVGSCQEEALARQEEEQATEEKAEQEEQAAVEAEEEEFEAEQEAEEKNEKKEEAAKGKEERETERSEEETEPPEPGQGNGEEKGKGPPAETPSGNEPPAGGVGPGTEVE